MTMPNHSQTTTNSICGVLVHARPEHRDAIQERLLALPGVEIHAVTEDGRVIVTVEGDETSGAGDTLIQMQNIDGVLSAALVYQYSGTIEDTEQEVAT